MSKRPAAPRGSRTTASERDRRAPATQQRATAPVISPRPTRAGGTQPIRREQRGRSRRPPRPWWRGPLPIIGVVVLVIVLVIVFIVTSNNSGGSGALIGKPFPTSLQQEVTNVPASVIAAVGTGGLPQPYVARSEPALTSGGKPELLFVGAEYCPHCAAERWSLLNALSRFGTFSNLHYMRSAPTDGDIATITFYGGARYSSPYLTFLPIENADRNGQQLQSLTAQQDALWAKYSQRTYPFLDFAGQYTNDAPNSFAGGYDYSVLSGMDWSQIAGALKDASNPVTKAVIGNANYITAAICAVTHNQPAGACASDTIQRIEQQLPKHS